MNSLQSFSATVATDTKNFSFSDINGQNYITRLPNELKLSITQYLSIGDLGHLAQTSKLFYDFITPLLYTKDSQDEWPRAIFWAVSVNHATARTRNIIRTLDLAIEYGGDVNKVYRQRGPRPFYATPLHLATVSGKLDVVERLLKHKAKPNAFGKGFLHFLQHFQNRQLLKSSGLNKDIAAAAGRTKWRPLFFPFLMEYEEMTRLLLKYGASPVLAVTDYGGMESMLEPGSINVLHVLASQKTRRYTDASNLSYFKKYSSLINVPLPRGETPLFTALRHGDITLLKNIIANGGDIEGVNHLGRTPLIQAITSFNKGQTSEIRIKYMEIIDHLIKICKVNVSKHLDANANVLQTPLTCAAMGFAEVLPASKASKAVKDITSIIDLLLDSGANVNEVSNHGYTALSALCRVIFQKEHGDKLLGLFDQLVKTRGADISVLFPNGHSMLGACIILYEYKPRKFFQKLLESGAIIAPHEADAVFERWAVCRSFRHSLDLEFNIKFNIFDYTEHITQDAIDIAYMVCIDEDEKILDTLQGHFPNTTVPEQIASEALLHDKSHNKRFKTALKCKNFNGGYIHTDGNSLLHLIVGRAERDLKYKDSQAFEDAKTVLLLGASAEATDDWGKTPLDKLMDMYMQDTSGCGRCSSLRFLLLDIKEFHERLRNRDEKKNNTKDQDKQEYHEIINKRKPEKTQS